MKLNKILVVGGTGYLGRHLRFYLSKRSDFQVWYTGSGALNAPDYFRIDYTDRTSYVNIRGLIFDLIIILASKLNSLGTTSLQHDDLELNTLGYASFLQFLASEKITEKIIYSSSMTVYALENELPIKETGLVGAVNTYGLSKEIAESFTSFLCRNNIVKGVILRLPGIYGGEKNHGFISNLVSCLKANRDFELNSIGLKYWEAIHIDDLCEMMLAFLDNYLWTLPIEVYNICYGQEVDFNQTAIFIQKKIGKGKLKNLEKEKGYIPFYLSNEKFLNLTNLKRDYYKRLNSYIETAAS